MPEGTAGLLKSVWQSQKRTLQYAGESLKTAEAVTTSLPQGDPWSMIAMAAVLLISYGTSEKRYPTRTSSCTWMTDHGRRNRRRTAWISGKKWKTWSSRLGLKENASKEKYYHEDPEVAAKDFVDGWCPGKLTTTSRFWKLGSRREKEEY